MAFDATFKVDDKSFRVLSFFYNSSRSYDRSGRPTSQLSGIRIEMTVESAPDTVFLHMWAYNNADVRTGTITFLRRDSMQKQAEIIFKDGYIVDISTNFKSSGAEPMTETFVVYANEIEYTSQGIQASNMMDWPG